MKRLMINPIRFLVARPRLSIAFVVGVAAALGLRGFSVWNARTCWIAAWNIGVIFYLGLLWQMIRQADGEDILRRARHEDEGANLMLLMVVLAAAVSLLAIINALSAAHALREGAKTAYLALTGLTIVSSWLFTHAMFALHYAHNYYLARALGHNPGLDFPGDEEPDYYDFLYFACIIGTSGQTADVSFTARASRRIGTVHCVFAFFYNAAILALLINIAAGLIGG